MVIPNYTIRPLLTITIGQRDAKIFATFAAGNLHITIEFEFEIKTAELIRDLHCVCHISFYIIRALPNRWEKYSIVLA